MYLIPFLVAFAMSFLMTPLFARLARNKGITSKPKPAEEGGRKQARRVPYFGGIAIIVTFFLLVGYYAVFTDDLIGGILLSKNLWGLLIAGIIILIGGVLDDKYSLSPKYQWIFGFVAILVVIASGIGIEQINNPFNGAWDLNNWTFTFFQWGGLPYKIVLFADLFTILWISGMDYSMQWIDGFDGLASGISIIGFVIIFFMSASSEVMQPEVAFLSIVMAGALIGFFPYAWPPSKVFGGQEGSQFWGFMLGVLAIISGAKIATALLVMGIPIIDAGRVIILRLMKGKSPFKGDAEHIHHWLQRAGLSEKQTIIFLYALTLALGVMALLLQGFEKFIALIVLVVAVVVMITILAIRIRKRENLKS